MPILRSIPARAGEPSQCALGRSRSRVYPRACGGTGGDCKTCQFNQGLSPRVRGNQERHYSTDDGGGSIPARAGEPPVRRHWNISITVYPRACGGTPTNPTSAIQCCTGLSPRVRGNPGSFTVIFVAYQQGLSPRVRGNPLAN